MKAIRHAANALSRRRKSQLSRVIRDWPETASDSAALSPGIIIAATIDSTFRFVMQSHSDFRFQSAIRVCDRGRSKSFSKRKKLVGFEKRCIHAALADFRRMFLRFLRILLDFLSIVMHVV